MLPCRLGVNIDHIATVRNARGEHYPEPVRALSLLKAVGVDSVTIHLREDRRHIRDADVSAIIAAAILPVNLEIAATDEMLAIAKKTKPFACCIVPEKREEITTEGGLDVCSHQSKLSEMVAALRQADIRTSLFVEASEAQIAAAKACGADAIEIHTGAYASATGETQINELNRITQAAKQAVSLGLECHAGHGLTYDNVAAIAKIAEIEELNIGHFLIAESIFVGLKEAVKHMQYVIDKARQ